MHIFPGMFSFKDVEESWKPRSLQRFIGILNAGRENILGILGSHIHRGQIRMPQSSRYPELQVPIIVSQSMSPVYMNNPSVTTLQIVKENDTFSLKNM